MVMMSDSGAAFAASLQHPYYALSIAVDKYGLPYRRLIQQHSLDSMHEKLLQKCSGDDGCLLVKNFFMISMLSCHEFISFH
jgi:hypothetical protein